MLTSHKRHRRRPGTGRCPYNCLERGATPPGDGGVRFAKVCGKRSGPDKISMSYVLGHWAEATPMNARNERTRMVAGVLVTAEDVLRWAQVTGTEPVGGNYTKMPA